MSHGSFARGLHPNIPRSAFAPTGVFGRMFPTLDVQEFSDDVLMALAARMQLDSQIDGDGDGFPDGGEDNPFISAGYTFLGQFIDHDITFDPTSSLERQNDPEAIYNFRTPMLELDSVYGSGPLVSTYLYNQNDFGKFIIGRDSSGAAETDVPRTLEGIALIGDPRNDENLIVSQLHLLFLKFHNRVVEQLKPHITNAQERFEEAQRIVRWHYQWIVVFEFLPRILGDVTWRKIFNTGGDALSVNIQHLHYPNDAFIPVEFAVAAYRFGHSMVRGGYSVNATFPRVGLFVGPASLNIRTITDTVALDGTGVTATFLKPSWSIDWGRFFGMGTATSGAPTPFNEAIAQVEVVDQDNLLGGGAEVRHKMPQLAKRVDAAFSPSLFSLPNADAADIRQSLAFRNLKRGAVFNLPWGQNVAAALGQKPLTAEQLAANDLNGNPIPFPAGRVPLWYYILKESEIKHNGRHLGSVGGMIVGEVFAALLAADRKSFLSQQPGWKPGINLPFALADDTTDPSRRDARDLFTITDLIKFVESNAG